MPRPWTLLAALTLTVSIAAGCAQDRRPSAPVAQEPRPPAPAAPDPRPPAPPPPDPRPPAPPVVQEPRPPARPSDTRPPAPGRARQYFLAAEEMIWDYAPSKLNLLGHGAQRHAIPLPYRGNTRWRKVRYIEYTDDTFKTKKEQPAWLGVMGPILRAEVGDTIVVHFWNRARRDYSVHPHGVRYGKDHEGAHYAPAGLGARVAPGRRFSYTWTVDEASGPGPADPSSVVWWYHSHVDEPNDVNAGLLGPLVVTARGKAKPDGTPTDVDRELVVMVMNFNEARGQERGMMHSINGFVFGNVPSLTMKNNERVRWYLLGMGNEKDLHTMHWHGKTLRYQGRNTDVIELLPGSMATADMLADNLGTWLLHCHVADHMHGGMLATYTIGP